MGYSCELNYPYSGALVPMEFYHDENPKIQSVMLEINRRVYLNGDAVSEKAVCNIDKIINFIEKTSSLSLWKMKSLEEKYLKCMLRTLKSIQDT